MPKILWRALPIWLLISTPFICAQNQGNTDTEKAQAGKRSWDSVLSADPEAATRLRAQGLDESSWDVLNPEAQHRLTTSNASDARDAVRAVELWNHYYVASPTAPDDPAVAADLKEMRRWLDPAKMDTLTRRLKGRRTAPDKEPGRPLERKTGSPSDAPPKSMRTLVEVVGAGKPESVAANFKSAVEGSKPGAPSPPKAVAGRFGSKDPDAVLTQPVSAIAERSKSLKIISTPPPKESRSEHRSLASELARSFSDAAAFMAGVGNAWVNNNSLGIVPREKSRNPFFRRGQTVGDLASAAQGVAEFVIGGMAATGAGSTLGAATIGSGGVLAVAAIPAGAAVIPVALAVAGHGITSSSHALNNLREDARSGSAGTSPKATKPALTQQSKKKLAKQLAQVPESAQPVAQGGNSKLGRWWEYKDVNGKVKIIVEHPDGSIHAGTPKPQSLHHQGKPPKFYDDLIEGGLGHIGDVP